jgi:hypothetical protein
MGQTGVSVSRQRSGYGHFILYLFISILLVAAHCIGHDLMACPQQT